MPGDEMEQDGVVRDMAVEHEGQTLTAVYFVEHGQIQVKANGKIYRIPKGEMSPAESVRGLLVGLATDGDRKRQQASKWSGWTRDGDETD